ncbi:tRNA-uridine aminocarboxypropyltransferase [Thalassotalea piscium]|uniref:tRNA-uridine aminocarboxypropyltransferase n=2 Tax=Thalassotalea piscium TaxID=1230533 RepID=A0A7X0NFE9_9GAMM|nr:DTW domain-containing protein YfiP [Thalassotalea piscium]
MISIKNEIEIIILQHPSEVKQSKATVPLLAGSLAKCHVFTGENFDTNESLQQLIAKYSNSVALLYPSEFAQVLANNENSSCLKGIRCLILLDGTWKKAYRIYQLNTFLHQMPHWVLPDIYKGKYQIRKTTKLGGLSTLEACCYALTTLENGNERYKPLLDNFVAFNLFQQRFVPTTSNNSSMEIPNE